MKDYDSLGLVLNTDRQDAISPIVNMLNLPRLYLYKGTGVYPDPHMTDVEWCVYCPFDTKNYVKSYIEQKNYLIHMN